MRFYPTTHPLTNPQGIVPCGFVRAADGNRTREPHPYQVQVNRFILCYLMPSGVKQSCNIRTFVLLRVVRYYSIPSSLESVAGCIVGENKVRLHPQSATFTVLPCNAWGN